MLTLTLWGKGQDERVLRYPTATFDDLKDYGMRCMAGADWGSGFRIQEEEEEE
jgi:hypothetical protein